VPRPLPRYDRLYGGRTDIALARCVRGMGVKIERWGQLQATRIDSSTSPAKGVDM